MLIKNKKLAIIAAILTFIAASALIIGLILYIEKIPLSGLKEGQNQLYFFSGILISVVLASFVYGRGSNERAEKAIKVVDETFAIEVKAKDMWKILRAIEQMPPFVVEKYVSMNINLVEELEDQIKDYKNKLNDEDLLKIRKVLETPVEELQSFLKKLYDETKMDHFRLLAEREAKELIITNVQELKKILFEE